MNVSGATRTDGTGAVSAVGADSAAGAGFVSERDRFAGRGLANAMTVDVEDYFQVSAFENQISRSDWQRSPCRLHSTVGRILEMFETGGVRATFFTLAWVAENHPEIVREIVGAGHELASHGCDHRRVTSLSPADFLADLLRSKKLLEDVSGAAVKGYRAPSFSFSTDNLWAYDALAEAGYQYSSSVFPIKHDHYGIPGAPRFPFRRESSTILEIPMTSINLFGRNWPCAGGGYFRLLPPAYFRWGISRINEREEMPAVFYFHPWELDPSQPRVPGISTRARFRHYVNLHKFEARLRSLLQDFAWDSMDRVYLETR